RSYLCLHSFPTRRSSDLINGLISIGVIVIFTEYARQFTRPLNELSNQFNILLSAVAGAERVFNVMDEEQEEADEQDENAFCSCEDRKSTRLNSSHVSISY